MGKGSARRNEDSQKVRDNWDLIWGKKEKPEEEKTLDNKSTETDQSTKTK